MLHDSGDKVDHFYTLDMLVACEESMNSSTSSFVSGVLASVQAHLKLLFNNFIEGEIAWITNIRVSAKRCGVLQPMV